MLYLYVKINYKEVQIYKLTNIKLNNDKIICHLKSFLKCNCHHLFFEEKTYTILFRIEADIVE